MNTQSTMTRRTALQVAGAAGAGLALSTLWPGDAYAQGAPILKAIPKSGEKLPAIGLGTNTYGVKTPEEMVPLKEVLAAMPAAGGTLIDTAPGYGTSEIVLGQLIGELGTRDKFFLATKVMARGGDVAAGVASIEESFRRLKTDRLDLLQVHDLQGVDAIMPTLEKLKADKRVRYIGITSSNDQQYDEFVATMKKHGAALDFVQIDYSLDNRNANDAILPLAQELKLGVLTNYPLGGRRGSLFRRVQGQALPAWAKEFDATSWAHVFLKYVISHPAITAAIPGTTKVANMQDNQGAGKGRLPNAAQRAQIEKFWDALPPASA